MKKIKEKIKVQLLTTELRYLDVSVCAKHFYDIAETWWYLYETFSKNSYKNVCLKEYYKYTKLAKLFERSC